MYNLFLVFFLLSSSGPNEEPFMIIQIDYNFRTETGCFLAGSIEHAKLKSMVEYRYHLAPFIESVDIVCENI